MAKRLLYRKRSNHPITAVRFDLDFDTFQYRKWGDVQTCTRGDWLVDNDGDVYTVKDDYFKKYYDGVSPGLYEKTGEVWAEVAGESGAIPTEEGSTSYIAGDYLVFDREEGGKGYAVEKVAFKKMYEKIDEKNFLSEEQQQYLDTRILPVLKECERKLKRNRLLLNGLQLTGIVTAALIPFFTSTVHEETHLFKWLVGGLGVAAAVSAGVLKYFNFPEGVARYADTHQELESHLVAFQNKIGTYKDTQSAFGNLVENCERILTGKLCGKVMQGINGKEV